MSLDVTLNVEVDRQIPDAESDGTEKPFRGGRYGEGYILPLAPTMHWISDEGTYQIATTPTPGTSIAFAVNTGVSETAGNYLYLKNNDVQGNARAQRLYLHYIRLIMTAVPAAGISGHFFVKVDNRDRYASGGTQLAPANGNIDGGAGTISQAYVGAITTLAPTPSARLLSRGVLRSVIPVVNDEYIFKFGGIEMGDSSTLGGIVAQRMVIPCPPVILGPQSNMCLQLWFPSNAVTPASFEVEMGWFER